MLLSFLFSSLPKNSLIFLLLIQIELFYPQFLLENAHWLIDKTITSQVLWKFRAKTKRLGEINTQWLNERYLPSIWMGENKIQLFLLKDSMNLENVWFRLVDLLLTFHKSLVIVWNSQRLWKSIVLEFWTVCISYGLWMLTAKLQSGRVGIAIRLPLNNNSYSTIFFIFFNKAGFFIYFIFYFNVV